MPGSATAAAHQAVRPHHLLGRLELRLELPATGAGEPHGGLGGRVLLPPALDLGGRARGVLRPLFGLGPRGGRLPPPPLRPRPARGPPAPSVPRPAPAPPARGPARRVRRSSVQVLEDITGEGPAVGRRSPLGAIRGPATSSYLFQPSTRCTGPV